MIKRFVQVGLATLVLAAFAAGADEAANIRAALAKVLPDYKPTSVKATPMKGLYEVEIGPQVMFVTGDGRYLIDGAIVDLKTRENIAESAQSRARLRAVDQIGEDNMIVFNAPSSQHTVTVFTDIDCGYCRKLHEQMDGYADEGISVRYLFYPRTGADTPSFDKAVSVWCADDRQEAMTRAKAGAQLPKKSCTNPVTKHMELGEMMGIRGTPAIILDNGEMVPGYVEPKRLATLLDQSRANN
ncbi:DsbC family protein [Thiohalocapsa sp. ML1]|jgi:thiol:disulfide interchange protein DsbC|uniref:DsbC family protein n=1 Tax=Thiohalocapsa sp. ML1 TaxID=1431688 RepID=UPI00073205A9|nr:DsbC family protein [Thiohalocapsa sp. ML1]